VSSFFVTPTGHLVYSPMYCKLVIKFFLLADVRDCVLID